MDAAAKEAEEQTLQKIHTVQNEREAATSAGKHRLQLTYWVNLAGSVRTADCPAASEPTSGSKETGSE